MLNIEINESKKIIKFAIIFNNLKNIFNETNMYFNENGLYLQAMDSSQICCCEFRLSKDWFCKYEIKKDVVIGINLEVFDKILSCLDRKLRINIKYQNDDKFSIQLKDDNITKIYQVALIDIDSSILEIPEVDYSADIYLKSMCFKNYINELALFGDDMTINCNEKNIILKSSGNGNSSVIIIKDEYLEEYSVEEDIDLESTYNIQYLKNITNFVKLKNEIYIGISSTYPLVIIYNLTDDKENYIKFYVAPKIVEDD